MKIVNITAGERMLKERIWKIIHVPLSSKINFQIKHIAIIKSHLCKHYKY